MVGEIYNLGCDEGSEISVKDLAEKLVRAVRGEDVQPQDWIEHVEDRPFNDKRYYISNQKLKGLGWRQHVPLLGAGAGCDEVLTSSHTSDIQTKHVATAMHASKLRLA